MNNYNSSSHVDGHIAENIQVIGVGRVHQQIGDGHQPQISDGISLQLDGCIAARDV